MYVLNEQAICEVSGGEKMAHVIGGALEAAFADWVVKEVEKGASTAWNWFISLF